MTAIDRLVEDTAWHPVPREQEEQWGPVARFVYRTFLGSPLKLWASVGHWLIWHFDLDLYTEKQKPRVSLLPARRRVHSASAHLHHRQAPVSRLTSP